MHTSCILSVEKDEEYEEEGNDKEKGIKKGIKRTITHFDVPQSLLLARPYYLLERGGTSIRAAMVQNRQELTYHYHYHLFAVLGLAG